MLDAPLYIKPATSSDAIPMSACGSAHVESALPSSETPNVDAGRVEETGPWLEGAVTGVCQGQERLFKLVPQESGEGVQGMGGSRVGSESEPQGTRNNDTNPRP